MMENKKQKKLKTWQKILAVVGALFVIAAVAFVFLTLSGTVSGMGYIFYLCVVGMNLCIGLVMLPEQKTFGLVFLALAAINAVNAVMRLF